MEENKYLIKSCDVGKRLDVFLSDENKDKTRSSIKKLITENMVFVNGKNVKSGYVLKLNDEVVIYFKDPDPINAIPENIDLNIIYEDEDLIIINKPQGMVVHPAISNYSGTLVNALLYHIKNLSGVNGGLRPGIVHRLDKNTSGILIVAKNDFTHVELSKQLQEHKCKRIYRALVDGVYKEDGEIETRIGRDSKNRLKQAVVDFPKGRIAKTKYRVIETFKHYSYMEFELVTGRTHQIRVHTTYLHHPIIGDELYNYNKCKFSLNGQLLHAYKLEFQHPRTKEVLSFTCEIPDYFEKVLNNIRNSDF